jgi:hypothetical protein
MVRASTNSNSSYHFRCHWGIFSKVARAVLDDVSLSWSSRFVKRSDMFGVFVDHKGTTCPSFLKTDKALVDLTESRFHQIYVRSLQEFRSNVPQQSAAVFQLLAKLRGLHPPYTGC